MHTTRQSVSQTGDGRKIWKNGTLLTQEREINDNDREGRRDKIICYHARPVLHRRGPCKMETFRQKNCPEFDRVLSTGVDSAGKCGNFRFSYGWIFMKYFTWKFLHFLRVEFEGCSTSIQISF